jgi:hypothetical protein
LYEAFIMKLITEIFSDPENHNKLWVLTTDNTTAYGLVFKLQNQ